MQFITKKSFGSMTAGAEHFMALSIHQCFAVSLVCDLQWALRGCGAADAPVQNRMKLSDWIGHKSGLK